MKKKTPSMGVKASHLFIIALALVSITGFIGIVARTLFDANIEFYVEASWMIIIGIGLVLEGQITRLIEIKKQGLTPTNFTHLVTVIIGLMAVIAGIFSFPFMRVENNGFIAVKGVLSVIAIIVIIIQTWIIE